MKTWKQKNWKQNAFFGLVAIIALSFAFIACDDGNGNGNDDPKDQSQTITLTFGETSPTATVKGHLTDTEWNGVADKIKNTLNARYADYVSKGYDGLMDDWEKVFNRGVTIIVEKTSTYAKWKTTTDGKTMYLNFVSLDTDLQGTLDFAVQKMLNSTADNG